jgi:hypothetical protein
MWLISVIFLQRKAEKAEGDVGDVGDFGLGPLSSSSTGASWSVKEISVATFTLLGPGSSSDRCEKLGLTSELITSA